MIGWMGKAALVLSLALAVDPAPAQEQPAPGRAQVIGALRQGDNQQALALAQQALAGRPEDCGLLSLKAMALGGLKQEQAALDAFQAALGQCPAYLPALEGAAQIEYARQKPDAAPLLARIVAIEPGSATAQAMLASVYRREHRCTEALPHYAASGALFPSRPELRQGYGACLADTGDLPGALAQFSPLLAAQPSDILRYNVALLQWKTHANAAALETLEPLLSGQDEHALQLGSRLYEEQGNTPKAVSLLRSAILLAPENADNYVDFAELAFRHQSLQVGIDMVNAGLARLPQEARLYVARGVLEAQLTRTDAAVEDFERAHRLDPKLSFAEDAVGVLYSQQHQDAQSLALFERQAKLHPEDPLLQYLLAEQLAQAGQENVTAAISAAQHATALDPEYEPAHDLLAKLYLRAGKPQQAIAEAERALKADPNDEQALYQKLLAERRSGNAGEVRALAAQLEHAHSAGAQQTGTNRYRLEDSEGH